MGVKIPYEPPSKPHHDPNVVEDRCLKREMVRERSGHAERASCRLPFGHAGAHQFADSAGDVTTRAWKDPQSYEARLRLAARAPRSS